MVTEVIGQTGGTVDTGAGTKIQIPDGALGGDTEITMLATPDVAGPASSSLVGPVFTFGPEGTQFATPVTVTLPFDSARLPDGATADDILVLTAPAGTTDFKVLPTQVSADGQHVEALTSHFSIFCVEIITANGEVVHYHPNDPNGAPPPPGVVLDPTKTQPGSSTDGGATTDPPPDGDGRDRGVPTGTGGTGGTGSGGTGGTGGSGGSADMGATVSCSNVWDFKASSCSGTQKCSDGTEASISCDGTTCFCGNGKSFPQDSACGGADQTQQAALRCGFEPAGEVPPPNGADGGVSDGGTGGTGGGSDGGASQQECSNSYAFDTIGCRAEQKCPDASTASMQCDGTTCSCGNGKSFPQDTACEGGDRTAQAALLCGFQASGEPPPIPSGSSDGGTGSGSSDGGTGSGSSDGGQCGFPQVKPGTSGTCSMSESCNGRDYLMVCDGQLCNCTVDQKPVASFTQDQASCDLGQGTVDAWKTGCGFTN